jgi:hypothetical protein
VVRRLVVIALIMVVAWPDATQPAAAAGREHPAISATRSRIVPGQWLTVTGRDFPALERLSVTVCGDRGLIGSAGCDLGSQATLLADGTGAFAVHLHPRIPPAPCPCVIEVDGEQRAYRLPLTIRGASSAPIQTPPKVLAPHLRVADAHLDSGSRLQAWFGLPTTGTLTFTLINSGTAPAVAPTLVLDLQTQMGQVTVGAPGLGEVAGGERRTYHVPVPLDPLTSGRVVVRGGVQLPLGQTTVEGSTLVIPWGWLALLLLTPATLVLRRHRRPRGRHRKLRQHRWSREPAGLQPGEPKAVTPLLVPAEWGSEAAATAATIDLSLAATSISTDRDAEPAGCR